MSLDRRTLKAINRMGRLDVPIIARRLCLLLAGLLLQGQTSTSHSEAVDRSLDVYSRPQTLATLPDHRRINFFCAGRGEPTTIIIPGWSVSDFVWRNIQGEIARKTRVCVYNRAAYGLSDPGPMPRDTAASVSDLEAALPAAKLKPPYILVGHSLGGFDARMFAYRNPKRTAGVLLLDPPTEKLYLKTHKPVEDDAHLERCIELAKVRRLIAGAQDECVANDMPPVWSSEMRAKVAAEESRPIWFETLISEDESMINSSSSEIASARRALGNIPLIVLGSGPCTLTGKPPEGVSEEELVEYCSDLKDIARDSKDGHYETVVGSSHEIAQDRPKVVLSAFDQLLGAYASARGR